MQNELVEVRGLSSLAIDQHAVLADKVDEVIKRLDNE
jgi:hypothetical protein